MIAFERKYPQGSHRVGVYGSDKGVSLVIATMEAMTPLDMSDAEALALHDTLGEVLRRKGMARWASDQQNVFAEVSERNWRDYLTRGPALNK